MMHFVAMLMLVMGAQERVQVPKGMLYRVPEPRVFQYSGGKSSVLYREDFESGASGWTITNGVWEIGTPSYGPNGAHSGVNCAGTVLDGEYPDDADTRLIGPSINLPVLADSVSHLMLSFWHWFQIESGYDNGYVEISTDGGTSWTQVGSSVSGDGSSWRQYTVMLDQFAGQTINIAFRFTSDYSVTYAGWYIDDVAVVLLEPEPVNVEIRSISTGMFPFVFLTVSADTFGAPIYTLDETNFRVFENGVLQTDHFEVTPPDTSGGVRAVDIVFCMDNSGSMEDEITGVSQHVADFVQQLQQGGYDFALGLVRFGGWENGGYPIVEDNGLLTSNINYFINDLWARNHADGGFEPGWDAMVAAATQMHWRPGSQKVIVLITDESPTGDGNVGYYTYDQTLDILLQNNATVFAMIDPVESPPCVDDYGSIANATGGAWFNIQAPMDSLLNALGGAITSTYVLRYRASDTTYSGQREVVVRLTYGGDSDEDTTYYTAGSAPRIILTDSTQNLINTLTLVQGQDVDVTVYVVDHIPPGVCYVRLYYRHHGDATYQVAEMVNLHDSLYAATIPSTVVDTPGIEFYFEASDSLTTVTLPSTNPHTNPFVVAVWPNYAPFIFHIPPVANPRIRALVFDNTNNIEHVWLYFREIGTILWDSVQMSLRYTGTISELAESLGVTGQMVVDTANARGLPLSQTHTAGIYEGYISVSISSGAEYYIKATDNWGIAGFHGYPDNPHLMLFNLDFPSYVHAKRGLISYFQNHDMFVDVESQISDFVDGVESRYNNGTGDLYEQEAVARLYYAEMGDSVVYIYADSTSEYGGEASVGLIVAALFDLIPNGLENSLVFRVANDLVGLGWDRAQAMAFAHLLVRRVLEPLGEYGWTRILTDTDIPHSILLHNVFEPLSQGCLADALNYAQNNDFTQYNLIQASDNVENEIDQFKTWIIPRLNGIKLMSAAADISELLSIIVGLAMLIVLALTGGVSAAILAPLFQFLTVSNIALQIGIVASSLALNGISLPSEMDRFTRLAFDKPLSKALFPEAQQDFELAQKIDTSWADSLMIVKGELLSYIDTMRNEITSNNFQELGSTYRRFKHLLNRLQLIESVNLSYFNTGYVFFDAASEEIDSLHVLANAEFVSSGFSVGLLDLSLNYLLANSDTVSPSVVESTVILLDTVKNRASMLGHTMTALLDTFNVHGVTIPLLVNIPNVQIDSTEQWNSFYVTIDLFNPQSSDLHNVKLHLSSLTTQDLQFQLVDGDSIIRTLHPYSHQFVKYRVTYTGNETSKTVSMTAEVESDSEHVGTIYTFWISMKKPVFPPLSNKTVFAYPNPFNPTVENATISYSLSKPGSVTIKIYDIAMNHVKTLMENQPLQPGQYTITWDGKNERGETVANGVYFFVIKSSSGERGTGKIAVKR